MTWKFSGKFKDHLASLSADKETVPTSKIRFRAFLIQARRGKPEKEANIWELTIQNFDICVYIGVSNPLCQSLTGCKSNPGSYIKVKLSRSTRNAEETIRASVFSPWLSLVILSTG